MPYRINSPQVIHQVFDSEVVIVNLETGNYYSVRGSGIEIWQRLESGMTEAEITNHFQSAADADKVRGFIQRLREEQLIVIDDAVSNESASALPPLPSFAEPVCEKFTDMRDMLLVDPIHKLDESGWPKPAPPAEK